jgi:hypothetical protein
LIVKKQLIVALVFLASSSLAAEVKYTVRVEARKGTAGAEVDPMLTMLGNQILEATAPNGEVELKITLGNGVGRVEWSQEMPGIPEGAVLLQRRNGTRVMFNPADRTWWRVAVPTLSALSARRRPIVTLTPSIETGTTAGPAATRTRVDIVIPFPEAQAGEMVSGTPTELPLNGEIWVTSSLAKYVTPELQTFLGMGFLGVNAAPAGQFVLRQILRGPTFGEMELESIVTSVAEEALPASTFEVPQGFKEVTAPQAGG